MRIKHTFKQEEGFTLIELMAVLAILTMLVLIAVPAIGSITKKAEAQADDATISMIEKAGGLALLGDVTYDDPDEEQYDVTTLVEEGYLDIDAGHKYASSGNAVTRIKGYEFEFESGSDSVEVPESPQTPVTETDESLFDTRVITNGTISIRGYRGTATDVVIPTTIDGIRVTDIGDEAFYAKGLTSVVMPSGIRDIGDSAFSNNRLTSVVIPENVVSIGEYAFYANDLVTIDIPASVKLIYNYAFGSNDLTSIVVNGRISTLNSGVFSNNKLTSLVIPDGVSSIRSGAFTNNPLTTVTVSKSVTIFGGAFDSGVEVIRR